MKNFDKHAKDYAPLEEGDTEKMKPFTLGDKWSKVTVTWCLDNYSYEVEAIGSTYCCNRVNLKKTSEHTPPDPLQIPVPAPVVTQPHQDPMSHATTAEAKSCPPVKACRPVTQTSSSQKLHTPGAPQTFAKSSPMKTPSTASSPKSKIPKWMHLGHEAKYHTKWLYHELIAVQTDPFGCVVTKQSDSDRDSVWFDFILLDLGLNSGFPLIDLIWLCFIVTTWDAPIWNNGGRYVIEFITAQHLGLRSWHYHNGK